MTWRSLHPGFVLPPVTLPCWKQLPRTVWKRWMRTGCSYSTTATMCFSFSDTTGTLPGLLCLRTFLSLEKQQGNEDSEKMNKTSADLTTMSPATLMRPYKNASADSKSFTVQTGLGCVSALTAIRWITGQQGKLGQSIQRTGYKWVWTANGAHVTQGRPICEIFHEAGQAGVAPNPPPPQKKNERKKKKPVLPAASLLHDLQLLPLVVKGLGEVSVLGDASDLRVVLELLPQLLVVVYSLPLSGGQLRDKRRGVGKIKKKKDHRLVSRVSNS